jgi:hypothetical protein
MKKFRFITLALSLLSLASCGGNASDNSAEASTVSAATLTAAYSSPAQLSYSNMRPSYNYYLTTFEFETLELYSDDTYCLSVASSTFSAVILPESGNAAQGNERTNYLTKYYGTFTKETDELDDDTLYVKTSVPARLVSIYDSTYYIDTDNWTDNMKKKSADKTYEYVDGAQKETGSVEYATGAEYLAAHNISSLKITCAVGACSMEYVSLSK